MEKRDSRLIARNDNSQDAEPLRELKFPHEQSDEDLAMVASMRGCRFSSMTASSVYASPISDDGEDLERS